MNKRKHWFVALTKDWETWTYAGKQGNCHNVGHDLMEQNADCGGESTGFWIAPGHRSRANCDTDCPDHTYTVESEKCEWVPR